MAIKKSAAVGAAADENQAGRPDCFQCSTKTDAAANGFSAALLAANKQLLAMREAYQAGRWPRTEDYARLARVQ